MAILSLPLNFNNSFWSIGYRKGLEVLYAKLEQGVLENDEIIMFIRARAHFENQMGSTLSVPIETGSPGTGFSADDGASLLLAFRGLQTESAAQGQLHKALAHELDELVAAPFDQWAQEYKEKLAKSRAKVIDGWLKDYEMAQAEVTKMRNNYVAKTRMADEADDDAKFAPTADTYTTSPRMIPRDARAPQRAATVTERISQRFREFQGRQKPPVPSNNDEVLFTASPRQHLKELEEESEGSETEKENSAPAKRKVDKGKAKATNGIASPPPLSLPPRVQPEVSLNSPPGAESLVILAGVAVNPGPLSALLSLAAKDLAHRSVRFPLLGEYNDCFTGAEFVVWLANNVPELKASDGEADLDRAEDAARDLTEKEGLLRRIGELGNAFECTDDVYYQFRPKAFDLEGAKAAESIAAPVTDRLIKRSNTLVGLVSKALAPGAGSEPLHIRARREAENADKVYRVAVRKLDRHRLALEETIENNLKTLQKAEAERLRTIKSVLLQYHATMANIPKSYEPSISRSATLISAFNPDSDLTALIERYRTGPFRPTPQLYDSVAHDERDAVFGVDLRKLSDGGWSPPSSPDVEKDLVPPVLTALLWGLNEAYSKLPTDAERRKAWIYEVPLSAVHHLREALNAVPPDQPIPPSILEHYDAPVLASAVKLWLLELDPPIVLWESWDELRKLYPTVGSTAKTEDAAGKEQKIQDLSAALYKLPRVHLHVLDALIKHLKTLIQSTTVKEPDAVYITKLALAVGRSIVRPKVETEITIQDRHPTLLFIDLINDYEAILPPTLARKKRESGRKALIRKRTAPVDMRLSRSKISSGADHKQLLAAQQAAQNPSLKSRQAHPGSPPLPQAAVPKLSPPLPPPVPPSPELLITPPPPRTPPPPPPLPPTAQAVVENPSPQAQPKEQAPEPESGRDAPPQLPGSEDKDLSPRPEFKDPPPEAPSPPPMPKFADPPPEEPEEAPAAKIDDVSPKAGSPRSGSRPTTPSDTANKDSRSQSPATADAGAKPSLSRNSSASATALGQSRVRKLARGPRAPEGPGNTVSSMVSNLNRHSIAAPSGSTNTRVGSPPRPSIFKRLSSGGSPSRASLEGRGHSPKSSLSRRTMASDAEEDIVS